jgi:hypothetical protein
MLFNPKWKDKYEISWCSQCDTAIITCPKCHASSCNGSSCPECHEDSVAFGKLKTSVQDYLPEAEQAIYEKAMRIRSHILDTLGHGESEIDWEKLAVEGRLSEHDMLHILGWPAEKRLAIHKAFAARNQ